MINNHNGAVVGGYSICYGHTGMALDMLLLVCWSVYRNRKLNRN